MRQPFWVVYLVAALLLLIAFWVVGLATESFSFATLCYIWSVIGLLAAYLQSHTNSVVLRGTGTLIWLGGLLGIMGTVGNSWQAAVAAGASGDLAWLMIIAVVTVIVVYLVGRWWGEFYAALSFIVVPVLSIFGLSIPMLASIEIVFAIIASLVVGVFLVSIESLLIRWQRGQLGEVTPSLLLSYCWRLSVTGSAMVLTIGLLLVPPATIIQGPLSQQLLRLPVLPFARFHYNAVEFPDLFTMPGGPITLPDIELFRVRGTDYPRWRVRTYVYYVGSGWRVSNEVEDPQLPTLRVNEKFLEMIWRPENKPSSPPIRATVSGSGHRIVALYRRGEDQERLPSTCYPLAHQRIQHCCFSNTRKFAAQKQRLFDAGGATSAVILPTLLVSRPRVSRASDPKRWHTLRKSESAGSVLADSIPLLRFAALLGGA